MIPKIQFVSLVIEGLLAGREKLLSAWSIIPFICLLLTGCVESGPRLEQLFTLYMQATDLPEGWYREKGGIGDRDLESEAIISRWVQFRGVPEKQFPGVLVSQELIDYPVLEQATHAYTEIVEEEYPAKEWVWPEQIQFESKADQFSLACLDVQAAYADVDQRYWGMYHCTIVGRYGSIISIIYASVFQDEWLTFEDLQSLLEVTDTRLAGGQP